MRSGDIAEANRIVRNLTKSIDKAFPEMQKVLDKLGPKEKRDFYKRLNDLLFEGDISKGLLDPRKVDNAMNDMRALGVTGETTGKIMNNLQEARAELQGL